MNLPKLIFLSLILTIAATVISCAPTNKLGMITDPASGLQYGSIIERSFFVDASQFDNNKMKISARNVSGDSNYNIHNFVKTLEDSFVKKGFRLGAHDNFGIKFDVNIEYSGHIQQNMQAQYSFLGGVAGGIGGYRSNAKAGEAIGILAGATIGAIAGSYVTDDTYIIISRVTIGVIDQVDKHKKTITFSSSPKLQEEENDSGINAFQEVLTTRIAVFAGGPNVDQSEIVQGVKKRLHNIISDVI